VRSRPLALALALAFALVGCAAPAVQPGATASDVPLVDDARPEIAIPKFQAPIELGTITLGAEPSVAVGPNGTVYVTTPLALWRSDDHGKTFKAIGKPACDLPVVPVAPPSCPGFERTDPGLVGGGDASLAVTKDGTVHWAGLGDGIPYQRSTDQGESWSEAMDVSNETGSDREWAVVDSLDRLFIQWRGADEDKAGIFIRSSDDAGLTWGNVTRVADDGRQGPVAPDPITNTLLLPHQLPGKLLVAKSVDRGASWTDISVRSVNNRPFIFPIAAFDANGTAYLLWSEDPAAPPVEEPAGRWTSIPSVYLSVSRDQGDTWSEPRMLSTPGVPAVLPWMAAGKAGRVVVVWYEATLPAPSGRTPNEWYVKAAMSTTADRDDATFATALADPEPVHVGPFCTEGSACSLTGGDRSMLDFFEVRLLDDGSPVLAYAKDADVRMATIEVWTTRMIEGTSLL
jgi:hypothetical protein